MCQLARAGAASEDAGDLAAQFYGAPGLEVWIRGGHFQYRGEDREVLRTVARMFADLDSMGHVEGDCDDISTFAAAILTRMGIRNRFVAIRYGGDPEYRHVFGEWWNTVSQEWERFDVTVPRGTVHEEDERMVVDVL